MNNNAVATIDATPTLPVTVNVVDDRIYPCLLNGESRRMWIDRLKDALGTESEDLANYALVTMFRASKHPEALKLNAMIETVRAGHARDPQETLLLVQMAAVSQRLQESLVAEMNATLPEDRLVHAKIVRQYGQLYCRQIEALRKYRRDGNQQITVMHIDHADAVGIKAG
ncbi:MAG: hypothetical protein J6I40_00530 [Mailhella sp.]|nr:hypothetical protein [Mailhella sp.]